MNENEDETAPCEEAAGRRRLRWREITEGKLTPLLLCGNWAATDSC